MQPSVKPWDQIWLVSSEPFEFVQAATRANRLGHGEIIWAGWNGNGGAKGAKASQVAYGSQFVAYTRMGAHALLEKMDGIRPEHWDMFLKRVLCSATDQTAEPTVADEHLRKAFYIFHH